MSPIEAYVKSWCRRVRQRLREEGLAPGHSHVYEALAAYNEHMSWHAWSAAGWCLVVPGDEVMLKMRMVGLGYSVEQAARVVQAVQQTFADNPFVDPAKHKVTLDQLIQAASRDEGQGRLSDEQQLALFRVIAAGCRQPTKHRLISKLNLPLSLWPGRSLFRQVTFMGNGGVVDICASQCYSGTVREIREAILKF